MLPSRLQRLYLALSRPGWLGSAARAHRTPAPPPPTFHVAAPFTGRGQSRMLCTDGPGAGDNKRGHLTPPDRGKGDGDSNASAESHTYIEVHSQSHTNIEVRSQGAVRMVVISRPDKRNCVDSDTAAELYEAFQSFETDDTARVGVLCGEGGNFCAGYDLQELAQRGAAETIRLLMKYNSMHDNPIAPMGPTRMMLGKPLIAAVSGFAVAGGLELALMCDLRVAEESAVLGVFNRRFGVPLIDGCTVRLPAIVGLSRALDLILTGRPVGSKEALQMGLVNRVVPDGTARDVAMELASQLAAFPQTSLLADRKSVYHSTFTARSLVDALAHEADGGSEAATEALEGANRFVKGEGRSGTF